MALRAAPCVLPLVVLGLLAIACGGKPEDPCPQGGLGAAVVEASGLPQTAAPAVTLTGPQKTVEATGVGEVTDLPTGLYGVTAATVAAPEDRVRRAFTPSLETLQICVTAQAPAPVRVSYREVPSSGKLWAAGTGGAAPLLALGQQALSATASGVPPEVAVTTTPGTNSVTGVTFDAEGNLWLVDRRADSSSLRRIAAADLGASGTRAPDLDVRGPALQGVPGAQALAFDAAGNLWVSVHPSNTIVRFTPEQLRAGGEPTPAVVLGGPQSGLASPAGLAFDAAGNLWVTSFDSGRVARYRAQRLDSSVEAPDLVLEARSPQPVVTTLGGARGLAFDGAGNLWVAYSGAGTIARFTPADLAPSGDVVVTPAVQVRPGSSGLDGLAFDEGLGLWTTYGANRVARLSVAQLLSGGDLSPEVVLEGPELGTRTGLAVYPAPAALPLLHGLP
jgi:sugar lactone lactonase YvrE